MSARSPQREAYPTLGTSPRLGSDDQEDELRPRSKSQRFLDALPTTFSEHLHRKSSHSPDGIGRGLAQAGLILGSTGSEHLINRSIQEIRDGAQAFLIELNRVVSSARSEGQRTGIRRVNTDIVQGTIQLQIDADSENDTHAITRATDNPFDPALVEIEEEVLTPLTPTSSEQINDYFIEDISVPHHDTVTHHQKLFMRARLDSGMEDNAISEEKALETGFAFEPYTGRDIIVGDGKTFRPIGFIELQFHFQRVQSAKTWKVRFLIFPDPPFDVAFGRNFIFKAKLFMRPSEALPMEYAPMTSQQEADRRARISRSDQQSSSRQSYQDSQYANRRSKPPGQPSSSSSSRYSASHYSR